MCLDHSRASSHRSSKEPKVVSPSAVGNRVRELSASSSPTPSCGSESDDGFQARKFALSELVAATGNFKDGNYIGEGGFGQVYKGRLPDGEVHTSSDTTMQYNLCISYVCKFICVVNADCGH